MPITKRYEEQLMLEGSPEALLASASQALASAGYKKVTVDAAQLRVRAQWKPLVGTLWGDIEVLLTRELESTRASVVVNAAVDNVFALGTSPGEKLLSLFREAFVPRVDLAPVPGADAGAHWPPPTGAQVPPLTGAQSLSTLQSTAPEWPAPEWPAPKWPAQTESPQAPAFSVADELEKLADLKARGVLSDEEFDVAKARLLAD